MRSAQALWVQKEKKLTDARSRQKQNTSETDGIGRPGRLTRTSPRQSACSFCAHLENAVRRRVERDARAIWRLLAVDVGLRLCVRAEGAGEERDAWMCLHDEVDPMCAAPQPPVSARSSRRRVRYQSTSSLSKVRNLGMGRSTVQSVRTEHLLSVVQSMRTEHTLVHSAVSGTEHTLAPRDLQLLVSDQTPSL